MHDAANNPLPYRYAYWAEDLDGYLDASQVGGQARASGTTPQEIAMWTVFNSTPQTDPGTTAATALINNRPLLFTVPTVRQIAQTTQTTPDAGPNLAVRLGVDAGEQNLVPLGYGYTGEGQPKSNLNYYISQLLSHTNGNGGALIPLGTALPAFQNRNGPTNSFNYLGNLAANIADYTYPTLPNGPSDFNPPGNPHGPPGYRGIGAYPFVVSLYDLNNWVSNQPPSKNSPNNQAVIEVKTYVQLWNPHNIPVGPGPLTVEYDNSDQVSYNGHSITLTGPPHAIINFTNANGAPSDPNQPFITSTLNTTGKVNRSFNYQITATVGNCAPMPPNSYLVVVLPQPTINSYGAIGLPPGLTVSSGGLISGTPTTTGTFNVTINATNSSGTTGSATLVITVN
jgi:hypothetical protein